MPNQEDSKDVMPRKDKPRTSPDVERYATDGQSSARAGAGEDEGGRPRTAERPNERAGEPYAGDGPGKVGLTSDKQPDLVAPSGVNERDHGAAGDKPMGGGSVNFDDDDITHPRGKTTRTGGTWDAKGGDSAPLGAPREVLSDRNAPSDPANRKK
jgi:hypothetical protein